MNYFLHFTSKSNYPLNFSMSNIVNGSYIAMGKYVKEELTNPLVYEDAENSDVSYEKLLTYDVLETVGGGVLISSKLLAILKENFASDIQLFNTLFTYKNNECESYSALNVYNKLECYDLNESVYKIHPVDQSYRFTKIKLQKSPLEEYDYEYNIIRSAHDNKIVVSEKFRKLLEDNKINSISFKKS